MCLIAFAYGVHQKYRLVMVANRDEFYGRPTASAHFWKDGPEVLAGRDLKQMGTWMGVTKTGKFAAVTNHRDPSREQSVERSRGHLVADYLCGPDSAARYMKDIRKNAGQYNGFNLIAGDSGSLFYFSNRGGEIRELSPGFYGLSNALLDTPWQKVNQSKKRLKECLEMDDVDPACLFNLLSDSEKAEDEILPDTGIDIDRERLLSSAFIQSANYGTRASTIMLIDHEREILFEERSFSPYQKEIKYRFHYSK